MKVVIELQGSAVIMPGGVLKGNVRVETSKVEKFRGIDVTFKGTAHCSWSEGSQDHRRHYSRTRQLCKTKFTVAGVPKGGPGPNRPMPVGTSRFPFEIRIPNGLPPSFRQTVGYVAYVLKVRIGTSKFKSDPRASTALQCTGFGSQLPAPAPVQAKNAKSFLFSKGKAEGILSLPSAHIQMGSRIPLTVVVNNGSKKSISGLRITLVQTCVWKARSTRTARTTQKFDLASSAVEKKGMHESTPVIQLPPNMFHQTFSASDVCDVTHQLMLVARVNFAKNLEVKMPITMHHNAATLAAIAQSMSMPSKPNKPLKQLLDPSLVHVNTQLQLTLAQNSQMMAQQQHMQQQQMAMAQQQQMAMMQQQQQMAMMQQQQMMHQQQQQQQQNTNVPHAVPGFRPAATNPNVPHAFVANHAPSAPQ